MGRAECAGWPVVQRGRARSADAGGAGGVQRLANVRRQSLGRAHFERRALAFCTNALASDSVWALVIASGILWVGHCRSLKPGSPVAGFTFSGTASKPSKSGAAMVNR